MRQARPCDVWPAGVARLSFMGLLGTGPPVPAVAPAPLVWESCSRQHSLRPPLPRSCSPSRTRVPARVPSLCAWVKARRSRAGGRLRFLQAGRARLHRAEPGAGAGDQGQRAGPAWRRGAHGPQPPALRPGVCRPAFLSRRSPGSRPGGCPHQMPSRLWAPGTPGSGCCLLGGHRKPLPDARGGGGTDAGVRPEQR